MKFTDYTYLWPPRPSKAIPVTMINFYAKRGFVGQYKKNGTCTVLYVTPNREVIAKSRHNDDHKAWKPTDASSALFKQLPGNGWYVFITELMHSKVPGIRDTHYVHDIVVADGEYLVGKTFMERQEILFNNLAAGLNDIEETDSHYVLSDNVWLAKLIGSSNFASAFAKCQEAADASDGAYENEGLVLKKPGAKLEICGRQKSNAAWQVKCRVSHKNYNF